VSLKGGGKGLPAVFLEGLPAVFLEGLPAVFFIRRPYGGLEGLSAVFWRNGGLARLWRV